MNLNYLISILNLYLSKENDSPLIMWIDDKTNVIKIDFTYEKSLNNKTYVKVDKDLFFNNIEFLIKKIQGNLEIINESFNNNTYQVLFNNKRRINFINFNENELTLIRNNFNNLTSSFNNIFNNTVVDDNTTYDNILSENKNIKLNLSFGFTSFITVFLTSILFLDVLMIALWIFKTIK